MIDQFIRTVAARFSSRDVDRDYAIVTAIALVVFLVVGALTVDSLIPKVADEIKRDPPPPVPVVEADFKKVIGTYNARIESFQAGAFPFLRLRDPAVAPK